MNSNNNENEIFEEQVTPLRNLFIKSKNSNNKHKDNKNKDTENDDKSETNPFT